MAKYLPQGTTFSINGAAVGGIVSVSTPAQSRGVAETTDADSDFDRSFIAGIRDGGTVVVTFRHNPSDAGQLALETNFGLDGSGAVKQCVITLPLTAKNPARTYTFDGFVTIPPSGDLNTVDDAVAIQSATIKVAGPVTIA